MGDTFPDGRWSWRPPITGQQTVANNLSGAKPRRQQPGHSRRVSRFEIRAIVGERGGVRGTLSHPNASIAFPSSISPLPFYQDYCRAAAGSSFSSRFAIRGLDEDTAFVRTVARPTRAGEKTHRLVVPGPTARYPGWFINWSIDWSTVRAVFGN